MVFELWRILLLYLLLNNVVLFIRFDFNDLFNVSLEDIVLEADLVLFAYLLADRFSIPIVPAYCFLTLLY